jgi:hypothetical protein
MMLRFRNCSFQQKRTVVMAAELLCSNRDNCQTAVLKQKVKAAAFSFQKG